MMTSLQLPAPRHAPPTSTNTAGSSSSSSAVTNNNKNESKNKKVVNNNNNNSNGRFTTNKAPSYEERCKAAAEASKLPKNQRPKLFVPRQLSDFDDGGAFPEIHVAQYPRHMGNPHIKKKKSTDSNNNNNTTQIAASNSRAIVNVQIDEKGEVSYDAIVKSGTNADKLVYTKLQDMKPGDANDDDIALPTEEEIAEETAKTQAAFNALLQKKTALEKPSGSAIQNAISSQNIEEKTQFIQYTANPNAPGYNPSAAHRVIQMVPAQLDPMMPPKHKHIKAPRGPAEDPVPVLHAPPTKLSKEVKAAWNIPACISNWKNTRGYTIPLDKRLAADGRGLIESEINSTNFAALSESLYVAEKQARQEVKLRALTQKKLLLQEKEQRENELRKLAQQARQERSGGGGGGGTALEAIETVPSDDESEESDLSDNEESIAAKQREKLRIQRKREREIELRNERNMELKKKQKLEEERDVSEKIALGVHTGTGGGGDNDIDSRLYNQTSGLDSGFGNDDEYNTYTKPLFNQATAGSSSIYRPTRGEIDADEQYDQLKQGATSKFQPHKGFSGAEGGISGTSSSRTAPVQFEKGEKKS